MLGTRVTFPSRGKSPKARQGLRPLESPEGDASLPPAVPATPSIGLQSLIRTDLPLWVCGKMGLCFLPKLYRGSHPQLSIRGAAGALTSRMLEGFKLSRTIPLGHRVGGIKGGYTPFAGGPGTRRFPGVSLPTFSTRESRPGRGAERPLMGRSAEDGAEPLLAWGDGPQPSGERSPAQRTPCEKAGVLSKFTICLSASSICVI